MFSCEWIFTKRIIYICLIYYELVLLCLCILFIGMTRTTRLMKTTTWNCVSASDLNFLSIDLIGRCRNGWDSVMESETSIIINSLNNPVLTSWFSFVYWNSSSEGFSISLEQFPGPLFAQMSSYLILMGLLGNVGMKNKSFLISTYFSKLNP